MTAPGDLASLLAGHQVESADIVLQLEGGHTIRIHLDHPDDGQLTLEPERHATDFWSHPDYMTLQEALARRLSVSVSGELTPYRGFLTLETPS